MKRLLVSTLLLVAAAHGLQADSLVGVREMALARVAGARTLAADRVLQKALAERNAAPDTPAQILSKDREWTADAKAPLRKALSSNACAERLRELTQADSAIVEVILMDARGANVCVSRETSDYWQGDEPKYQKTFVEGKEVFIDEPAFDRSSETYAIQLSVLIGTGQSRTGALTLTLRVPKRLLDAQRP